MKLLMTDSLARTFIFLGHGEKRATSALSPMDIVLVSFLLYSPLSVTYVFSVYDLEGN
jgi:hypothetical protein